MKYRFISAVIGVLALALACWPAVLIPDWFNGNSVSSAVWSSTNLRGGTAVQTGGQLILTAPAGATHDNVTGWVGLTQQIANANLDVIVKFASAPTVQSGSTYYASGIAFVQNSSNAIYMDYAWNGFNNSYEVRATTVVSGSQTTVDLTNLSGAQNPFYMEVIRSGNSWTVKYSSNGSSWTSLPAFTQAITVATLNLFSNNYNTTASSTVANAASFDYICAAANDKCIPRTIAGTWLLPSAGPTGGGIGPGTGGVTAPPPPPPTTACTPGRVTVTGQNNSGDVSLLQGALNGAGNVLLAGTFALGSSAVTVPANTCISSSGTPAVINYTGGGLPFRVQGNNDTIDHLVLNGGGIEVLSCGTYCDTSHITITNNVIQNITSGSDGIDIDGQGDYYIITGNTFQNIAPGGWSTVTASTPDTTNGYGIVNDNGLGQSLIDSNVFTQIAGDGMHLIDQELLDANIPAGGFTDGSNDTVSNNTFTHIHRIAIEWQGVGSTCVSGTCNFHLKQANTANRTVSGNFCHQMDTAYYDHWCYSNVPGWYPSYVNNTAVVDVPYTNKAAAAYEVSSEPGFLTQGNVASVSNAIGSNSWVGMALAGEYTANAAYVNYVQNNVLCGVFNGNVSSGYYSTEPPNQIADTVQYNYTAGSCPNAASPETSSINASFTSPNNQSFTSGGSGTWNVAVVSNLSIRQVQFYVDGTTGSPVVTQKLGDLNTSFASNMQWDYHATFSTTSYASGSHTIKAVVTDVSGATSTITQNWTR